MESKHKTRAELEEHWLTLSEKDWKCTAQKRFGIAYVRPMLNELDGLNHATDRLLELCQDAEKAAGAVREPDEDDE